MIKILISSILILLVVVSFVNKKEKKKVVFFGDSITAAGVRPDGYIQVLGQKLDSAAKKKKYELIGAGVSGNKVPDLQKRLKKDVLSKKPDIVVIYIGINDVWHWQHECCKNSKGGTKKEDFEKGLDEIIKEIKATGAKIVLCTPSVIGEKAPGDNELDVQLDEYSYISKKVAGKNHITLLDLRENFKKYIKENISTNDSSGILTYDGVHLNQEGNKFVAELMYPVIISL